MNALLRHLTALLLGFATGCVGTAQPPQNAGIKDNAAGQVIEGTAAYRERIMMPPNAVFEAVEFGPAAGGAMDDLNGHSIT